MLESGVMLEHFPMYEQDIRDHCTVNQSNTQNQEHMTNEYNKLFQKARYIGHRILSDIGENDDFKEFMLEHVLYSCYHHEFEND